MQPLADSLPTSPRRAFGNGERIEQALEACAQEIEFEPIENEENVRGPKQRRIKERSAAMNVRSRRFGFCLCAGQRLSSSVLQT
jgi:hypothetical protein